MRLSSIDLRNDVKKDYGDLMNDEIREVIKEVCIDTGSPVVLLHYYETAQDVMTAKEIRLSSGGETRLQCLGKYLERVNAYMSERVVCQLVLGYVDNQLEEQAGKIMRENKRREQQRCVPIPPTPQQPPSLPPLLFEPKPTQPTHDQRQNQLLPYPNSPHPHNSLLRPQLTMLPHSEGSESLRIPIPLNS